MGAYAEQRVGQTLDGKLTLLSSDVADQESVFLPVFDAGQVGHHGRAVGLRLQPRGPHRAELVTRPLVPDEAIRTHVLATDV